MDLSREIGGRNAALFFLSLFPLVAVGVGMGKFYRKLSYYPKSIAPYTRKYRKMPEKNRKPPPIFFQRELSYLTEFIPI